MRSASGVVIGVLWALSIGSTLVSLFVPLATPVLQQPHAASGGLPAIICVLPILLFGGMAFIAPHSPFYHPTLARFINARCGDHALESFLVRFKPLLFFALPALVQAGTGLVRCYSLGANIETDKDYGFMLSAGIGFALAHVVLYHRKAVGVFPTWTIEQPSVVPSVATPEKLTLREALQRYWKYLIGVAVFPTLCSLGVDFLHIPFDIFILPFFAVGILAAWPVLTRKAPYTFWLVAMGVWLVGGICAAILYEGVHVLLHPH